MVCALKLKEYSIIDALIMLKNHFEIPYGVIVPWRVSTRAKLPPDFKETRLHFVFNVKHDRRHKTILEVDAHLTKSLLSISYYGLVSLKGIRLFLFLA